jgi:hypothetical protein
LEFDIGFLLDVYFFKIAGSARHRQDGGFPAHMRHSSATLDRSMMAFGMPEIALSRQGSNWKCRKTGQLDILAFGMPKIDWIFL